MDWFLISVTVGAIILVVIFAFCIAFSIQSCVQLFEDKEKNKLIWGFYKQRILDELKLPNMDMMSNRGYFEEALRTVNDFLKYTKEKKDADHFLKICKKAVDEEDVIEEQDLLKHRIKTEDKK